MPHVTFAARIRWRSRVNPAWEIDTVHRGFLSAQRAALFANGLGPLAVEALWLNEGVLSIELTDGRRARFSTAEVVVWRRAPGTESLPDVAGFERVNRTPHGLSAERLDGELEARSFRVVTETNPEQDVEVSIHVDLARGILRVSVGRTIEAVEENRREPATIFGIVPKA
jgi:hypothetical protein